MINFLIRRLLLLVPVVFGIVLVVFIIVRAIPGDPCTSFLGERATPAACQAYRERMGLNESIPVQFVRYLGSLARGDFGTSIKTGQPVVDVIAQRLPMTFELAVCATLFATIVGVLLGLTSALKRNTPIDVGTMVVANIGVSMPVFWLGLMLAYVFALLLKGTLFYIPPSGRLSSGISLVPLAKLWNLTDLQGIPKFIIGLISNSSILNGLIRGDFNLVKDALWHLILPSVAVGTIPLAVIARMTRSSLLEVLGLDYIRTARAKGLTESKVIRRHAFRNALIPIVTVIGLEFGALLSGAVLTETVFTLPGVGTALVTAILSRDYPLVQGFTIVVALIFVFANLIVDISYAYLDPRIRLE
ncbi:MAG TPA: ABC transporter permease [Anaerolineaceae bacterium]|nr:ABC transporter permease [Anaerolineaceae bacterium]